MICDICGKKRLIGHKVSHSNIKTKKQSKANIQKLKVVLDNRTVRAHICTRCIKAGKAIKRVKR